MSRLNTRIYLCYARKNFDHLLNKKNYPIYLRLVLSWAEQKRPNWINTILTFFQVATILVLRLSSFTLFGIAKTSTILAF